MGVKNLWKFLEINWKTGCQSREPANGLARMALSTGLAEKHWYDMPNVMKYGC